MNEPNWAIVLRTLHEAGAKSGTKEGIETFTNLEPSQIEEAILYLQNARLIVEMSDGDRFVLTPNGFDVAHQRQMKEREETIENQRAKQQHNVNVAIAFLTLGLLTIGAIDMIATIEVANHAWNGLLINLAAGGVVIVVAIAIGLQRAGLLEGYE